MQGMKFYDTEEAERTNAHGKALEQSGRLLFNAYASLMLTFDSVADLLLRGEIDSLQTFHALAYSQFSRTFSSRAGVSDMTLVLPRGKDSFIASAIAYDSMGNVVPLFLETGGISSGLEKKLVVLRLQASHIHDASSGKDLGAVVFADTFFQLDIS